MVGPHASQGCHYIAQQPRSQELDAEQSCWICSTPRLPSRAACGSPSPCLGAEGRVLQPSQMLHLVLPAREEGMILPSQPWSKRFPPPQRGEGWKGPLEVEAGLPIQMGSCRRPLPGEAPCCWAPHVDLQSSSSSPFRLKAAMQELLAGGDPRTEEQGLVIHLL